MRINVSLPESLLLEVDRRRGDVSRSRFVLRALEAYVGGAVKGVSSPAVVPVAEEAAAPEVIPVAEATHSDVVLGGKTVQLTPEQLRAVGVVRASSLAKRDVRPIPKGKGK